MLLLLSAAITVAVQKGNDLYPQGCMSGPVLSSSRVLPEALGVGRAPLSYTVECQMMMSHNRSANRIEDFIRINAAPAIPANFVYCDKLYSSIFLDANNRSSIGPPRRMTGFDSAFEVLRIVIHATNNDDIFQPAGDEEFACVDESQITRTKERTHTAIQIGSESCATLLRPFPKALPNAVAGCFKANFARGSSGRTTTSTRIRTNF